MRCSSIRTPYSVLSRQCASAGFPSQPHVDKPWDWPPFLLRSPASKGGPIYDLGRAIGAQATRLRP